MGKFNKLKTKILAAAVIFAAAVLSLVPACTDGADSSVKSLTKPYIAEYTCVEAKFGEADLLKEYDFIKITLVNDEKLEISFKPKNKLLKELIPLTTKRAKLRGTSGFSA